MAGSISHRQSPEMYTAEALNFLAEGRLYAYRPKILPQH
jgi:hypothetical protein